MCRIKVWRKLEVFIRVESGESLRLGRSVVRYRVIHIAKNLTDLVLTRYGVETYKWITRTAKDQIVFRHKVATNNSK
jgi:hypothetical protein